MKKLSLQHKNFLIKKSRAALNGKRIVVQLDKKIALVFESNKYPYRIVNRLLWINAPENLDLSEPNFNSTVSFFKSIRSLSRLVFNRVYIDFTTIKQLSPLAALLLTSEIHQWQINKGRLRVKDHEEWSPNVKRLLHEMGFFDLVNISNRPDLEYPTPLSIKFSPFKCGHKTLGDQAVSLRQEMEKIAGVIPAKTLMYGGLTEAMKNVLNWAYDENTPESLRLWWMAGSYNPNDERMTIMIYDHGVGIPKTLPRSTFWEHVKPLITGEDDHDMIEAAMKIGRSATKESNRGKGLADIKKFVMESGSGILRIISGKGEYTVTNTGVEKKILHESRLDGTLIAWEIRGKKEDLND